MAETTTPTIDRATAVTIIEAITAYVAAEATFASDALTAQIDRRSAAYDQVSPTWLAAKANDAELTIPTFRDRIAQAAKRTAVPTVAQFRDIIAFGDLRDAWVKGAYVAKVNRDNLAAVNAAKAAAKADPKAKVTMPKPKRPTFSGYLAFARRAADGHYDRQGNLTDDGRKADDDKAAAKAAKAAVTIATVSFDRDVAGTDREKLVEYLSIQADVAAKVAELVAALGGDKAKAVRDAKASVRTRQSDAVAKAAASATA